MASPFSLEKGGVGRAEYAKLLAENQKRYPNDRDKAVRSANIAAGFGSSTAQRYLHGAGGKAKAGGGGAGGGKTKAKPNKPSRGDTTGSTTPGVPIPTPRPDAARPPDQMWQNPPPPPSPVRDPSLMWPGATGGGPPMPSPVPMNPALSQASILQTTPPDLTGGGFPPDLGVSPQHNSMMWPSPPPNRPAVNIGPAGSTVPPRPAQVGGSIFNRGGFRNEPQDPNESWWQALLRG